MRVIVEKEFALEVQENDNWVIPIGIDELATLPDPIPTDSTFHFTVFDRYKNEIIDKPNLLAELDGDENFIKVIGAPSDTLGHSRKCMFWELQVKTNDDRYYTIGRGSFIIHKTFIKNE
jgi:hypothetical protein